MMRAASSGAVGADDSMGGEAPPVGTAGSRPAGAVGAGTGPSTGGRAEGSAGGTAEGSVGGTTGSTGPTGATGAGVTSGGGATGAAGAVGEGPLGLLVLVLGFLVLDLPSSLLWLSSPEVLFPLVGRGVAAWRAAMRPA